MYTEIFCLRIGTLSKVVINCQVLYKVEKFLDFLTDHLSMIIFHIVNWFETGEGLIWYNPTICWPFCLCSEQYKLLNETFV